MVNTTVKEVTNPVAGQDADHAGGIDWNQLVQVAKGSHASERIQASSIQEPTWVTKTLASVTLGVTETYVLVDATSNAVQLTLPTAVSNLKGRHLIKRIDATVNVVSIIGTGGQTIDGKTTYYVEGRDEVVEVISDGSNWRISGIREDYMADNFRARGGTLNRYYSAPPLTVNTASTTATVVAATVYAFPFIVPKTITIDTAQINVTTLGAGSTANVGVYMDNGNLYPGTLLQDFGSQSTATTGIKTFTIGVPITLVPGLYWLAFVCTATAPVVSGWAIGQCLPLLGTTSVLTAASGIGWSVSSATLANPFTAGGAVIIAAPIPAMFVRVA